MSLNTHTIDRLHQGLFAPLSWLEQLESLQQQDALVQCLMCNSIDSPHCSQPLPEQLTANLRGLRHALEQLQSTQHMEAIQLFPGLERQHRKTLWQSLQSGHNQIRRLSQSLLKAVFEMLATGPEAAIHQRHGWDSALQLVPSLSQQLIRYLYRVETDYRKLPREPFAQPAAEASHSAPPSVDLFSPAGRFSHDGHFSPTSSVNVPAQG